MVKIAKVIISQDAGLIFAAATLTGSLLPFFESLAAFAFELFVAVFLALAGAFTLADLGEACFDVFLTVELDATADGKVMTF